ncbi:MAG TPA: riboflavin synthase [Chitinophagaceae bacterium]|nr:riboflavin synthase [Chitinophagaceae bacterium]
MNIAAMFTGIIETLGEVTGVFITGNNKSFWIKSALTGQLKVDQSIAHNGVCLTIEEIKNDTHRVTAVQETLEKTALETWQQGTLVNLERSLLPNSRLDGHFVQGHVDATATCTNIENKEGSFEIEFSYPESFASNVVEKGSISINGISLTVFGVTNNTFKVAIIPYTWKHTMLHLLKENEKVNIEFDLIGKYILRKLSLSNT